MKKEWVKPEIKFITDPDIILDASMKCMDRNRSLYWLGRISGIR